MDVRRRTRSIRTIWAPSLARRIARHRAVWAATAVLVVLGGLSSLSARMDAIDEERARWGTTEVVAVVARDIDRGEPVAGALAMRSLPLALVPRNAIRDRPDARALAKVPLFRGEVLVDSRVIGVGESMLPPGTVALTLPIASRLPLAVPGDLVDVWMIARASSSSERIAQRVVLLAMSDDDVTLAVPEAQVRTATAAALEPVTVTLVG